MDQPISTPPTPQPASLKWPFIAIFSFILGVASVLTYQRYLPTGSNPVGAAPSPVTAVIPSPSTKPATSIFTNETISAQIPGWKYYSNDNFTFQYPGEWKQDSNVVTADIPGVTITTFTKNQPMYNECMQLTNTDNKDNLMIKTFQGVIIGEACADPNHAIQHEIWITKRNGDGFQPGIIYYYEAVNPATKMSAIFDQIASTFKFTD